MQIELTPEQDDVVRHAIVSGRIARPEDAVAQAMAEWTLREQERIAFIASLDEAEASIARGEGILIATDDQPDAFFDGIEAGSRSKPARTRTDER